MFVWIAGANSIILSCLYLNIIFVRYSLQCTIDSPSADDSVYRSYSLLGQNFKSWNDWLKENELQRDNEKKKSQMVKCSDFCITNWMRPGFTLMACGRSGSFISLNCCGKFILFSWCTTAAGAAERPASCLTKRFWSSMRARISDIFVCSTIPPVNENKIGRSKCLAFSNLEFHAIKNAHSKWGHRKHRVESHKWRMDKVIEESGILLLPETQHLVSYGPKKLFQFKFCASQTYPWQAPTKYDERHRRGKLNLIRKHFQSIYRVFRRKLELNLKCLAHSPMSQHRKQNTASHNADRWAYNLSRRLNCHPPRNCTHCHRVSIPAGMFPW